MVITMAITASLNASSRPVLMAHDTDTSALGAADRWHPFPRWVPSAGWLACRAGDGSRSPMLFDSERARANRGRSGRAGRSDLGIFAKYARRAGVLRHSASSEERPRIYHPTCRGSGVNKFIALMIGFVLGGVVVGGAIYLSDTQNNSSSGPIEQPEVSGSQPAE